MSLAVDKRLRGFSLLMLLRKLSFQLNALECDTSNLPLQKSQLGAYQDDLKAALNQATWKTQLSEKTTTKTWHSTFLLLSAVDFKHTICHAKYPVPLFWPVNGDHSKMGFLKMKMESLSTHMCWLKQPLMFEGSSNTQL